MDPIKQTRVEFIDLPVEIRIRIYHYYFTYREHPTDVDHVPVDIHSGRILVKPRLWPLFQSCKQIYNEVMPEYYASTEFRFNALMHLKEATDHNASFKVYAQHISLCPQSALSSVEEIPQLPNLQTFTLIGGVVFRSTSVPDGYPITWSTLNMSFTWQLYDRTSGIVRKTAMQLHNEMANSDKHRFRIRFRFRYQPYSERVGGSNTSEGASIKWRRMIDYDCANDFYILLNPDKGEDRIIKLPGAL